MSKEPFAEFEGRLAAMELAVSIVLGAVGRANHGSSWASFSAVVLRRAIKELRKELHGDAAVEAETTLRLIFDRSSSDCRIDSFGPAVRGSQDRSSGLM